MEIKWLYIHQWKHRCKMAIEYKDMPGTLVLLMNANIQEMEEEIKKEDKEWHDQKVDIKTRQENQSPV